MASHKSSGPLLSADINLIIISVISWTFVLHVISYAIYMYIYLYIS